MSNLIDIFGKKTNTNNSPLSCVATDVLQQRNIISVNVEYRAYYISDKFKGTVCFEKNGTRLYQHFVGKDLGDVAKQVQDFCIALEP